MNEDPLSDLALLQVVFHCFHQNGIKRAAARMGCGETKVRASLAKFEAVSGFPLFQRRPWKPYPIAKLVVNTIAQPALDSLAGYYRNRHMLLKPHIRLGGPPYAMSKFIIPLLRMLRVAHPELIVSLQTGTSAQLAALLDQGDLDLALILTDAPPTALRWQQLLALPVLFYLRADCGLATLDQVLAASPPLPLICPAPGEAVARRFETFLRQHGIWWPLTMEVGSAVFVPPGVSARMGVGPSIGLSTLLEDPDLCAFPLPVEDVHLGAAWKKDPDEPTQQFLKLLAQQAPQVAAALLAASLSARALPKIDRRVQVKTAAAAIKARPPETQRAVAPRHARTS